MCVVRPEWVNFGDLSLSLNTYMTLRLLIDVPDAAPASSYAWKGCAEGFCGRSSGIW